MTTDDDMREIEAALEQFATDVMSLGPYPDHGKLLALIRQKLPQADDEWLQAPLTEREKASTELAGKVVVPWTDDAEHERAVEAWRKRATTGHLVGNSFYHVVGKDEIDEALRLMRARPAKGAP